MSVIKVALTGALIALAWSPGIGRAQTATTNFNVQITITAECKINSASDLNFGSSGVISANIDVTSAVVVQCTSGVPYNLALGNGNGSGASVTNRLMTGPGGATIGYQLYTTAARNAVWGSTVGTNTQTGTGNGAAQTFTVYGRVPAQTTPAAGAYSDIVAATLTY